MLTAFLQDQAALYALGAMPIDEREPFEIVLEFHHELRALVAGLVEVTAAVTLTAASFRGLAPSASVKAGLAGRIAQCRQQDRRDGLVVAGPDRRVQWVNPAFSDMCGYSLDELSGQNLGPILQGEKTDRMSAERMRRAVHEQHPCRETILNYHKNGTPYWVEVEIVPFRDGAGALLWFLARERELPERIAA